MTLIVTAAHRSGHVLQVGDRLSTKWSKLQRGSIFRGRHDEAANKMVIYRSRDGICTIGFAGDAYVDKIPTDEWIAGILWGGPLGSGTRKKVSISSAHRIFGI